MDNIYIGKGTLAICPYSGDPSIISSFNDYIDKSKCAYHEECSVDPCPLAESLRSM